MADSVRATTTSSSASFCCGRASSRCSFFSSPPLYGVLGAAGAGAPAKLCSRRRGCCGCGFGRRPAWLAARRQWPKVPPAARRGRPSEARRAQLLQPWGKRRTVSKCHSWRKARGWRHTVRPSAWDTAHHNARTRRRPRRSPSGRGAPPAPRPQPSCSGGLRCTRASRCHRPPGNRGSAASHGASIAPGGRRPPPRPPPCTRSPACRQIAPWGPG